MSDYTIIGWSETIPEGLRHPGKHAALFDALRQRPNEWAQVVPGGVSEASYGTFANAVRNGHLKGAAEGEFDARTRLIDGTTTLWLRYLQPGEGS